MVVLPGDGVVLPWGRRVVLTQGGPYLTALLSLGRRVVLTLGGPYLMALLSWGRRVVLALGGPSLMALLSWGHRVVLTLGGPLSCHGGVRSCEWPRAVLAALSTTTG